MEVKVLGSVSPYCKDDKNCPGYLVTNKNDKILLDCGNGVSRLLDMSKDLEGLNIIISHLHRDHYSDLVSIAYASYVYHNLGMLNDKVKVFIPKCDTIDYAFLHSLGEEKYMELYDYVVTNKLSLGSLNASFAINSHNILSHSIKVENEDVSLVYSGDTGYVGSGLKSFAKDSSLLICEATFLKGQKKGSNDYHLCAHEAAKIAHMAGVKQLMLTHFWPEIDKQEYVNEALPFFRDTIAAEEGKVLKLEKK